MNSILFVCLGNICRSPMAFAVMRDKLKKHNLAIKIDSAATSSWNVGNTPHIGTKTILKDKDIDVSNIVARQITKADFYEFDYIFCMDESNLQDLNTIKPADATAKIALLLSVLDRQTNNGIIPDPYYTGNFELTYELIDEATSKLIAMLQHQKQ